MQFYWLKAFLTVTEEQKFPQIWDLYSKIENNLNFYLSTLPAKFNDIIFQNKGKTQFWGNYLAYFVAFAQTEFFLKNLAKYNCNVPAAFKCQRQRIAWMSI